MSANGESEAGRREVAYRVFAAEYDDADLGYTENEVDERAPNYVVTPTGGRVNRLFVAGVLTEVEHVNEGMLRGRIVDPTGAFVVYAGQYEPDALTALERLDPPAFIAVTGKARTFQPEDAETTYTSVRPESINKVDADTRDRWTVRTARHTIDRIATFADALSREERGDELATALEADGVDTALAAGIPLAVDHYDTTPAYLDAIRKMSVEAVEVIAGEREEVTPIDHGPDAGGDVNVDLTRDRSFVAVEDSSAAAVDDSSAATTDDPSVTGKKTDDTDATAEIGATTSDPVGSEATTESGGSDDIEEIVSTVDEAGVSADESDNRDGDSEMTAEEPSMATDEMYEFDENEREKVESEFGTEFSTGAEVDEPGESDLDVPDLGDDEPTSETEPSGETETGNKPDTSEELDVSTTEEPEETGKSAIDVDLEDAVVEVMRDLDSGDGADRDAVIEAMGERHGVEADEVEDAIQDALMSGTCYEPGDGLLKPI